MFMNDPPKGRGSQGRKNVGKKGIGPSAQRIEPKRQ
jgi:hypothetical protein